MSTPPSARRPLLAAALIAAGMLGFQVASRATRDALFLSHFSVTTLPAMIVPGALASIPIVLAFGRLLARHGPARVGPPAFLASAATVALLWAAIGTAPKVVAVVLWLHVAVIGPIAISCFYALLSELFDARTAKRELGRIIAGGTLGGLAGGFMAERVGTMFGLAYVLPALVLLHAGCALGMQRLAQTIPAPAVVPEPASLRMGMTMLAHDPYLRNVALLVFVSGIAGTLLDYVFKAQVAGSVPAGVDLIRLFSAFYTVVSLLTFVTQSLFSGPLLERAGVGAASATMPGAIALGSLGALLAPSAIGAGIARGMDLVVRSGLFRPAYELLHAPLPPATRRSSKILVDVGCDRAADAAGGLLVAGIIAVSGAGSRGALLGTALGLGGVGLLIARGFRRAYVQKLEAGLVRGAPTQGAATRTDGTQSMDLSALRGLGARGGDPGSMTTQIDLAQLRAALAALPGDLGPAVEPDASSLEVDPSVADPAASERASAGPASPAAAVDVHEGGLLALRRLGPPSVETLPRALPALAHEDLSPWVLAWLRDAPGSVSGQLADFMLERAHPAAARRRIPRVLARLDTPLAVEALFLGLEDPRFEVRAQCGRALLAIRERRARRDGTPEEFSPFPVDRVFAAVRREVDVDRRVWEAQRDLRRDDDADEDAQHFDRVVRERAGASLDHVFTLLALALPRRPVGVAFQGLQASDAMYRGMALEYLESVLPPNVRERLWPFLEERGGAAAAPRPAEDIERDLLGANESMQIRIDELRRHGIVGPAPESKEP